MAPGILLIRRTIAMHVNIRYDETFPGHVDVGREHWPSIVILVNGVLLEQRVIRPTFNGLSGH